VANAKIDFTIGSISFSGEGEEVWLAQQLDKIIDKAAELTRIAPSPQDTTQVSAETARHEATKDDASISGKPLGSFLREKNATRRQSTRFLATAVWLHSRGANRLKTSDITQALKDNNQPRLGNPSRELASAISNGFAERDGKEFFVTDQGKASL